MAHPVARNVWKIVVAEIWFERVSGAIKATRTLSKFTRSMNLLRLDKLASKQSPLMRKGIRNAKKSFEWREFNHIAHNNGFWSFFIRIEIKTGAPLTRPAFKSIWILVESLQCYLLAEPELKSKQG